jgi:peptidoglycan/xylan/chitin deacetylase (PgdA/CDA1 family)
MGGAASGEGGDLRIRQSWYNNTLYVRAKHWLFNFLYYSGAVVFFRFLRRRSVLIAIYHDVLPQGFPQGNPLFGMTVSVEEFAWQIQYFKKHYNPISLQQFCDWYFHGHGLPPRPVLITFDDGHANNLHFALPILQKECVAAVCFVVTGELGLSKPTWFEDAYYRLMFSKVQSCRMGNGERWPLETTQQRAVACGRFYGLCRSLSEAEQKRELRLLQDQLPVMQFGRELDSRFEFLSEDGIRRLSENGVEIGAHSVTHPILSVLDSESARCEIADSKSALERCLGKPVRAFAYPFGAPGLDFTPRDEALVRESGYSLAFAGEGGFVSRSSSQFTLPRIGIGTMTRAKFAATVTGAVDSIKSILTIGKRDT